MSSERYLWKLYYPYLILLLIAVLIFGIYSSKVYEDFYISKTSESLKYRAILINEEISSVNPDSIISKNLLQKYDKLTDTRITLIDLNGKVIFDSRENSEQMESHKDRPEFIEALKGNVGQAIRYSHTLQTDLMYIAVPIKINNKIAGALRTSVPIEKVYLPFSGLYPNLIYGGFTLLIIIAIFGFIISRKKVKPIIEMQNAAERFAQGNFKEKIYPPKNPELQPLANSLNQMAKQIDEKINIIGEQKKLQQSILKSMKEGVLAVNYDFEIIFMNDTACTIFSVDKSFTKGRTLQETVRIPDIQNFVKTVMQSDVIETAEFVIKGEIDKSYNLKGTNLTDTEDNKIGILVLINDITELKFLETMKRDFVANVSHELKTPITAIKGFVETLIDGAINEPDNAKKFLEIIHKHTERMNAIVADLLSLSNLEEKTINIKFDENNIASLLKSAIDNYEYIANNKSIRIELNCPENLTAKVNGKLIVHAVGNLIDNAIKYSDNNSKITVSTKSENNKLIIKVQDEGCGFTDEHISRLFERFYRIEKSRNRDDGGTGLGLAIVKHITQVHNGTIEVQSKPGHGSVFSIVLPI